jgi:5-methylcytosine-specific restriction endonuclease McrA
MARECTNAKWLGEKNKKKQWWVARYDICCNYCGSEYDLALDHIRPSSRGGTDNPRNLQVLCRPCNSKKGTRDDTGVTVGPRSRDPFVYPGWLREVLFEPASTREGLRQMQEAGLVS